MTKTHHDRAKLILMTVCLCNRVSTDRVRKHSVDRLAGLLEREDPDALVLHDDDAIEQLADGEEADINAIASQLPLTAAFVSAWFQEL